MIRNYFYTHTSMTPWNKEKNGKVIGFSSPLSFQTLTFEKKAQFCLNNLLENFVSTEKKTTKLKKNLQIYLGYI